MKLNYSYKKTITTADLYDATDPPLTFEVLVRPPREWSIHYAEFEDGGGDNIELAKELLAMTFLSVSDGQNTYPLSTVKDVEGLQAAIEANNPGYGAEFICNMVWAFGRKYFLYLRDNLGNLIAPLPQSNGSGAEKTQALAS